MTNRRRFWIGVSVVVASAAIIEIHTPTAFVVGFAGVYSGIVYALWLRLSCDDDMLPVEPATNYDEALQVIGATLVVYALMMNWLLGPFLDPRAFKLMVTLGALGVLYDKDYKWLPERPM